MDFSKLNLNPIQEASVSLIRTDLSYIYTVFIKERNRIKSNYYTSITPFLGTIVDGAENWFERYVRSLKSEDRTSIDYEARIAHYGYEKGFYESMRSSVKMWSMKPSECYQEIEKKYLYSEKYFKEMATKHHRTKIDIYGVDLVDGHFCGNTILSSCCLPHFSFEKKYGEFIKSMAVFAGRLTVFYNATNSICLNHKMIYEMKDYGATNVMPFGNKYSYDFVLFSVLCQINFVIYCIDQFILDDISTKLRFAYIIYYYLTDFIPSMNKEINTGFVISDQWRNEKFRNCMAHYALGVVFRDKSELKYDDPLYGLTQYIFNIDYKTFKDNVINCLSELSNQISKYLNP